MISMASVGQSSHALRRHRIGDHVRQPVVFHHEHFRAVLLAASITDALFLDYPRPHVLTPLACSKCGLPLDANAIVRIIDNLANFGG